MTTSVSAVLNSARICPACRHASCQRTHVIIGPHRLEDVIGYPFKSPRVSGSKTWWNKGFVKWFIDIPEDNDHWYITYTKVRCLSPDCDYVGRLKGDEDIARRQFCRARLFILRLEGVICSFVEILTTNNLRKAVSRILHGRLSWIEFANKK